MLSHLSFHKERWEEAVILFLLKNIAKLSLSHLSCSPKKDAPRSTQSELPKGAKERSENSPKTSFCRVFNAPSFGNLPLLVTRARSPKR